MQRWSPRVTDLAGGMQVRRALPVAARRSVGPFVFFDHFGPVALPADAEQSEPAFQHVAAGEIPRAEVDGATVRVLLGEGFGLQSPVRAASPMLYLDIALPPGMPWVLPRLAEEMAIYSPEECIEIKGEVLPAGEMALVLGADGAVLRLALPTRLVVIGGVPLDPPRLVWWNFVASDRALIERAAERWAAGRFEPIPGETGGLPMPPRRL